MLAITTIDIGAFRKLSKLSLLNLERFNLFVGKNHTGKSSILEAIYLACRSFEPDTWSELPRLRIECDAESLAEATCWLFAPRNGDLAIEITTHGRNPITQLTARIVELREPLERSATDEMISTPGVGYHLRVVGRRESHESPSEHVMEVKYWKGESKVQQSSPQFPSFPAQHCSTRFHHDEALVRLTERALDSGFASEILRAIQFIEPKVTAFELRQLANGHKYVVLNHTYLGQMPLIASGTGLRRLFWLAVSMYAAKDGVLLIDDIAVSMHVGTIGAVCDWLVRASKELNVQVFASTHSLEFVDAMLSAVKAGGTRDLAVCRLSQVDEASGIYSTHFSFDEVERMRHDMGMEIR